MKKLLYAIITIQLIVIVHLIVNIVKKSDNILGKTSVNPIRKDLLDFKPSDNLRYFYEPKPDSDDVAGEGDLALYKTSHHINSDALSERFDYDTKRYPGTYRIITLGDSFTYGLYVETSDSWPERLEDMLNQAKCKDISRFDVINLAYNGHDIAYQVARFKNRGIKYDADQVIWLMVDMKRLIEKLIPSILELDYFKEIGRFKELTGKDDLYSSWKYAYDKTIKEEGLNKIYDYQLKLMLEFKEYFKGPLIVMSPPWRINEREKKLFTTYAARTENTYIFDKLTDLSKTGGLIYQDSHPNKNGHQKIAEDVLRYLLDNRLIPC